MMNGMRQQIMMMLANQQNRGSWMQGMGNRWGMQGMQGMQRQAPWWQGSQMWQRPQQMGMPGMQGSGNQGGGSFLTQGIRSVDTPSLPQSLMRESGSLNAMGKGRDNFDY